MKPGHSARSRRTRLPRILAVGLFVIASVIRSQAHTANESYLTVRVSDRQLEGRLDLARRDLRQGIALTGANLQTLAEDELLRREETIALDLVGQLGLEVDGQRLPGVVTDFITLPLNGGEYARILFVASGWTNVAGRLDVNCRALFQLGKTMHGLIRVEHGGNIQTVAFNLSSPEHQFTLASDRGRWGQWATFIREGARHIWVGFDHILFLLALLLPVVLRQGHRGWIGIDVFRPAFLNALKIVTAFTVAHSSTLSLAALAIIQLPGPLVESAFAASLILAATNNIQPWFQGRAWVVAFASGLIHGCGYSTVLGGFGLAREGLAVPLVGFNIGLGCGQLVMGAAFLPLAFILRNHWGYRVMMLKFGSGLIMVVAAAWMLERSLASKPLPDPSRIEASLRDDCIHCP